MNNASSSDGISRFLGNSCQLSFGRRKQFLSDAQHSIHKILRRGSEIARVHVRQGISHNWSRKILSIWCHALCCAYKILSQMSRYIYKLEVFSWDVSYWILIFKEGKVVIAIRFRFSSLEETAQTTMKWSGRN